MRRDPNSGKPGRRVRRGLGTAGDTEASRLVAELNEILRSPQLWDVTARATAAARFDPRIVEIFFDGIEPVGVDFPALRSAVIPLPTSEAGYHSVLLLGTTGAGKTTLVRQLLGTDPRRNASPPRPRPRRRSRTAR